MFPDLQTDLHGPDSVENDLRHSTKGIILGALVVSLVY